MSFINKIRVKNFKSLEDVSIEIKPLTFLFGPNSSGKSSFIKSLLFLKENLFPFNDGKTKYKISDDLNLICFKDIVYNNEVERKISFEFEIKGTFDFVDIDLFLNPDKYRNSFDIDAIYDELKGKSETGKNNMNYQKINNKNNEITKEKIMTYVNDYIKIVREKDFLKLFNEGNDSEIKVDRDFEQKHLRNNENYLALLNIEIRNSNEGFNFSRISILFPEEKIEYRINMNVRNNKDGAKEYYCNKELLLTGYHEYIAFIISNFGFVNKSITPFKIEDNDYKFSLSLEKFLHDDTFNENNESLSDVRRMLKSITDDQEYEKMMHFTSSWNVLDNNTKIEYFYKLIKIIQLSKYEITNVMNEWFESIYLKPIREIPKVKYILTEGEFEEGAYYGWLNKLYDAQKTFIGSYIKNNEYENITYADFNLLEYKKLISDLSEYGKAPNNIEELLLLIRKADPKLEDYFKELYITNIIYKINDVLKRMGFEKNFYIFKNNDIGSILMINKRNIKTNFASESSGLIQILPIIIAINLNNCGTILLEQPELHLHPKLQSYIAEEFSQSIKENSKNRTLIIETHSEHIIRKIQVLIAKKQFSLKNIGINYLFVDNGKTETKQMSIDESGFLREPWPDGFFDESYNLSKDLLFSREN